MSNVPEFIPENEEERKFVEEYNKLSIYMSEKLKELDQKDRLTVLRDLKPTDLSLMNLYLQSLKKEDYETCAAAKALLEERDFKMPNL